MLCCVVLRKSGYPLGVNKGGADGIKSEDFKSSNLALSGTLPMIREQDSFKLKATPDT